MDNSLRIQKVLDETFRGIHLRPFQRLIVEDILDAEEMKVHDPGHIIILPTGGGKSLCFMLPAILLNGLSIVVYPLLSLLNDQKRKLAGSPVPVFCMRGGQTHAQRKAVWSSLSRCDRAILLTTPETLSSTSVMDQIKHYDICLFVLDEAHTIVQWGDSFRPSYHELTHSLSMLKVRHVMAFTATAGNEMTEKLSVSLFGKRSPHIVRANIDRPNIIYHVRKTLCPEREVVLFAAIARRPLLVFCPTRKETERLAVEIALSLPLLPVRAYHAGMGKKEREETEAWFIADGNAILCATCAFGMGVDKPDIRTVVHLKLPATVEAYLQESGRAGRDGAPAHAYVIITGDENSREPEQTKQHEYQQAFVNPKGCIRSALLEAMGLKGIPCSGCDICDGTYVSEAEAEKDILSHVSRHPLRHTPSTLAFWLQSSGNRWDSSIMEKLSTEQREALKWTSVQAKEAVTRLLTVNEIKILHIPFGTHRVYPSFLFKHTFK